MGKDKEQLSLLDSDPEWKKHWKGMPEYNQQDLMPVKQIIISFETTEDMKAFSRLVGQTITMHTQSIWYPEMTINRYANKRFITKEEE